MKVHVGIETGIDKALMFVSPDDEVHEFGKEIFREVSGLAIGMMILVDSHDIEPVFLLHAGFEELDIAFSECSE
jgi:hypothetical protein